MKKLLVLLFTLSCISLFAAPGTVILGDPSEFTILFPGKPEKQERYAANLLAEYLEKIYKIKIPVVQEGSQISGRVISIGETALAKTHGLTSELNPQGYEFSVKGNHFFIRGGFPGPLNGVISYLEEDLGCRWYAEPFHFPNHPEPGLAKIPDLTGKKLLVTPRSYTPQFTMREIRYLPGWLNPDREYAMFFRLSPITYQTFLPAESGASLNSFLYVHTYAQLLPAKEYFEKHPEYYALQKGKRTRLTATSGSVCYTHPEVVKIMVENIRKEIRKMPDARYFSVSCSDAADVECECSSCAPIIKKFGKNGIQLYLANKIASVLCKEYPNIRITTLIYGPGADVLSANGYKAHPNVTLFLAPIGARWNLVQMLIPLNENPFVRGSLDKCKLSSSNIFFWDYVDTTVHPLPNFDQMRDSIRYLAKEKVTGYSVDCSNGGAALAPLKKWIYTQLVWNPELDMEALINEFISAYYGKASPELLEYVKLIRNAWKNFKKRYDAANGNGVMLQYSEAERNAMRKLMESAWKKAGSDDVLKGRIAREYLPFLAMELSGNPKLIGIEQYEKDFNLFCELLVYTAWNSDHAKSRSRWQNKLNWAKQPPDKNLYSPNTVAVLKAVYGGNNGYKDDPKALNGKASRHHGKRPWGIQWYYTSFKDFLVPGTTYVMRLRVRQECKKPRTSGKMFDLWTFHHGNEALNKSQGGFSADFTPEDANGEYRWVTLGKVRFENPSATGMFWMNSLVDLDEAIWYDRMELIPLEEFREKELIPDKTLIL